MEPRRQLRQHSILHISRGRPPEAPAGARQSPEDKSTASITVLAVTAQAMQGDHERFLAAGFDDYISKPVNIVELVGAMRQHCDGRGRVSLRAGYDL